jgi:hypothetical protein
VLHVHDLADFAAEEAEEAGRAAARYLKGEKRACEREITLSAAPGIGYVLPQRISLPADKVKVYFRVSAPLRDPVFVVRSGDTELMRRKKLAAMPGEMEAVTLTREMLEKADGEIVIGVEVAK